MIGCACRARLLLEATQAVRVLGERQRQDLDRHVARDARIAGPVDLPHPARPERGEDLVRAEARAGSEDQGCISLVWRPGLCLPGPHHFGETSQMFTASLHRSGATEAAPPTRAPRAH